MTAVTKAVPSVTWKWQSATPVSEGEPVWADIADATSATYTIAATDEGKILRAVATATEDDETYTGSVESAATAAVVDPNKQTIEAEAATWTKNGDTTAHNTDDYFKINQSTDTSMTNETMLLRYAIPAEVTGKIVKAELKMTLASAAYDAGKNPPAWQNTSINYFVLNNDEWLATSVYDDVKELGKGSLVKTGIWTGTEDSVTASSEPRGKFNTINVDVTSAVTAETDGKISLAVSTNTARMQDVVNAPTLVLTIGQTATFNVKNGETTGVENAVVNVYAASDTEKKTVLASAKTNDSGVASVALADGEYTYTVTHDDYAIYTSTENLTVSGAAVSKDVTLSARVPAELEIVSPDATIVTVDQSVTFTATVTDTDGREMTGAQKPAITWSIVNTPANISVTDGVVSATTGVTGGEYKVKAELTSNSEINDTADFTVSVAAKATLKVVYTTDGTDTGAKKTVVVYDESANKFENDKVTLDASYLVDQKVQDESSKLYKVYKYVSGGDQEVTLVGGENTVYITVDETDTNSYYYFNNFDDGTLLDDVVAWTAASKKPSGYTYAQIGRAGSTKIDNKALLFEALTGKDNGTYANAGYGIFNADNLALSEMATGKYTISFDVTLASINTAQDVALELIDDSKNVILGLDLNHTRSNSTTGANTVSYYTGGKCGFKVAEDGASSSTNAEGYLGEAAKQQFDSDTNATTEKTYTVTLAVDNTSSAGAGTLTISGTEVNNTSVTVATGKLSEIYMTAKCYQASGVPSTQGSIKLDNFKIIKDAQ